MRVRRVLLVDNYDSFVGNLYQYLGELGAEPIHRRNDAVTATRFDDGAEETVEYEFDANGNRTLSRIDFREVTRDFDIENRVTRRTDEFGNTIGYDFGWAAGNRDRFIQRYNQIVMSLGM